VKFTADCKNIRIFFLQDENQNQV